MTVVAVEPPEARDMTHGTLQTDNRRSQWRLAFVPVAPAAILLALVAEKARDLLARLPI